VRFENANDLAEMIVARGKKLLALRRRKLVRSAVTSAFFHKCERAIIHHDVLAEKFLGPPKALLEQSPQTFAADFAARTIKPKHRSLRIFFFRSVDACDDAEPVAHRGDLAKRNPRLGHPEWSWIHSEKDDAFFRVSVSAQIHFVCAPRVLERIVDMCHRRRELQFPHARTELLRGDDE